jgi:hypothetical protein
MLSLAVPENSADSFAVEFEEFFCRHIMPEKPCLLLATPLLLQSSQTGDIHKKYCFGFSVFE